MTAPLCFVDIETTGLHPDLHEPWEVAVIRRDFLDGAYAAPTDRSFVWQVADVDLGEADLKALEIGGFYDRHRTWAPKSELSFLHPVQFESSSMVATDLAKTLAGAHIVGVGIAFDADFLARMLRRLGKAPTWHYHLIDVPSMALGHLQALAQRTVPLEDVELDIDLPWRSDDLSRACGVDPPDPTWRHTALGDADWAKRWYDQITGRTE